MNKEFEGIHSVAFSPKGTLILTRSPRTLGTWSAVNGKQIRYRQNLIGIQLARFSPSGRMILAGTNYSEGQAWISETGFDAIPFPLVHAAQVWGIAADQKDERIITASFDHTARIWDRVTGTALTAPLTHRLGVSEATLNLDGTLALTGSWDGTARLSAIPRALDDQPARIDAWIETMTGLHIAPTAGDELLNPVNWRARKAELDRLGGPPIRIGP